MPIRLFSSKSKVPSVFVGVSVCASHIHLAAVNNGTGSPVIETVNTQPYNVNIPLEQQIGAILDSVEESCNVSIVLSQEMYHMVQVTKPEVPEEDIATALPWTLGDLVPYESANMVVDYVDYPVKSRTGEQKIDVFASEKAPLATLAATLAKQKDKHLTHIHTKEVLVAEMAPDDEYARLLIVQEPNSEPFLMIVRSGAIWLARRLRGFVNKFNETTDVSQVSDTLGLEIQRSMDFYESQLKQPPLKEILFKTQFDCEPVIERLKPFQPAAMKVFNPQLELSDVVDSTCHFALASALVASREV